MIIKKWLSPSSARALNKSIEHLLHYWNTPNDSNNQNFNFGIAFEALLMSGELPDNFEYFKKPFPDQTMAKKENKEALAAFMASEKTLLPIAEKPILDQLVKNCEIYKDTLQLYKCQRQVACEVELHGVKWIGFADLFDGESVIEIKTAHDASPKGLKKALFELLYHVQLRVYQLALGAKSCKIIAVEKSEPYMTNFVELSPEWLEIADAKIKELSEKFLRWQEASEIYGAPLRLTTYSGREASLLFPEKYHF